MIISFSKNNSSLNVPCVITLNGKTNIAQMSSIFSDAKKLSKILKHHVKGILIESLDSSIGGVHIVLVHKWNHKRTSVKKPTHTDYTIKKLRIKN